MSNVGSTVNKPKLKVIFNCKYFSFHRDYCTDIAEEINRRGGETHIVDSEIEWHDVDFTILPDEACGRLGSPYDDNQGKGIWINHAIPVLPENDFYYTDKFKAKLRKNADHLFIQSSAWKSTWEDIGIPMHVVGMPKLDSLFGKKREEDVIFYAPTGSWKKSRL